MPPNEAIQKSSETYFRERWSARDERFRCWSKMMQRGVADDFDFIGPDEMRRHPYYQEFLLPHGLQYFAAVKMAAGDDSWALSIQRSPQQGPFSPSEMRKLASLSKKLAGATAMARAFGFASANVAIEALELSKSAVALLNRNGELLRLNRAAEGLLSSELRVVKKRIVAHDARTTEALDRALNLLLWASSGAAMLQPVAMPRRGKRPILAYPIKLPTISANIFADCQALLVFVDLEHRPRPPQESLCASFALTPAEARLATRISSGDNLETVADSLCVSKETARQQLAAVFRKTGVRRQAELVGLLASFLHP
jgi:DNA-binding CsgD family transcriptional regulator